MATCLRSISQNLNLFIFELLSDVPSAAAIQVDNKAAAGGFVVGRIEPV